MMDMKCTIRRVAAGIIAAILLFMAPVEALEVSAQSAILLDGESGQVLWEKNADRQSLIASTTKIMTALVVLERAELDDVVEVAPEAVGIEGSSMYLKTGERLTVEDLLYGLMLQSGNDAAVALAIHVAGSSEAFAALMNEKAQSLGLSGMHFANPNGLDAEGNYATARSLGLLAVYAMEQEDFHRIVSTKSYSCAGHTVTNHNKLLWQYDGAVGVKTGFTKKAGRILVGSAERNGRRLVTVTLNAPNDWKDHSTMLDYGFTQYTETVLVSQGEYLGELPVISGTEASVPLYAAGEVFRYLLPGEGAETKLVTEPFVYAPVEAGTSCGTLYVYMAGKPVGQTEVLAGASVERLPEEPGILDRIKELF